MNPSDYVFFKKKFSGSQPGPEPPVSDRLIWLRQKMPFEDNVKDYAYQPFDFFDDDGSSFVTAFDTYLIAAKDLNDITLDITLQQAIGNANPSEMSIRVNDTDLIGLIHVNGSYEDPDWTSNRIIIDNVSFKRGDALGVYKTNSGWGCVKEFDITHTKEEFSKNVLDAHSNYYLDNLLQSFDYISLINATTLKYDTDNRTFEALKDTELDIDLSFIQQRESTNDSEMYLYLNGEAYGDPMIVPYDVVEPYSDPVNFIAIRLTLKKGDKFGIFKTYDGYARCIQMLVRELNF